MPKRVVWTPELVERFWNGFAAIEELQQFTFARQAGSLIVELASLWVSGTARCLDYGGGSGHLARSLIDAGLSTAVYEPSAGRVRQIAQSIGRNKLFLGAIDSSDTQTFDAVFCTEVLEHVLPGQVEEFAQAVVRRLSVGGWMFLTTPYAEDLTQSLVYCPVCDSTFHRWQHQRSCRPATVRALFECHGLSTEWIGLVGFDDPHPIRDYVLRRRLGDPWFAYHAETPDDRLPIIGRGDHIVYVGCKRATGGNGAELPKSAASKDLLTQGVAVAAREGTGRPLIVVPPAEVQGTERSNADAEVSSIDDLPTFSDPDKVIVAPVPLHSLEEMLGKGHVAVNTRAVVLENGRWVHVYPSVRHRRRVDAERRTSHGPWSRWYDRKGRSIAQLMRLIPFARRLQPWVDRREDLVLDTLLNPLDFPMRMSHVVRGRVLLAIGTLGSGGAERQLINTAEGLAARGVDDVHILVNHLHDDPGNAFYLRKAQSVCAGVHASEQIDPSRLPWAEANPSLRRAVGDGILARIIGDAKVIRDLAPEIVQASLDWTNVTVGIAAVLAGVPHVFLSGRNLSPLYFGFFQWFMYPCYRALAQCSGVQILNNSEAGRIDYAAWLRLDPSRIKVLRNGLHTEQFPRVDANRRAEARAKLNLPDRAKVVVGAFRLSPEKRPLLWIDAAAEIRAVRRDAIFLVCGVGPELEAMQRRARRRGIADAVQFLGARKDILAIYSAADLVLQTSAQEGTPNVLIEAQACGIPVVTTPAFGAAEAVHDGVTGFVVNARTARPIAQAALRVLDDQAFAARARSAGRPFVEARFGFDRMIDDTLELWANAGVRWAAERLPPSRRFVACVELRNMYREIGNAWIEPLPQLAAFADNLDEPGKSPLVLLEDGTPLGPAHSPHDRIREAGAGAYSHWNDTLYFSTSDGSDPRNNGRRYVAIIPRSTAL